MLGQFLSRRKEVERSRAAVSVPEPVETVSPAPVGTDLDVDGLSPFFTPNDEFYRVDTALFVPTVTAEDWSAARARHGRARAHARSSIS